MEAAALQCSNFIFDPDTGAIKVECAKKLISKCLGYGIMAGALGLKVPQILSIVSKRDVVGLSPTAMYNEVPLVLTSVAYNFHQGYHFSTYGEMVFVLIQNIILVFLLWKYSKPAIPFKDKAILFGAFVAVTGVSFAIPAQFQPYLQYSNLPLLAAARVPQIWANFKAKSTGQLSFISNFLSFAGGLARIFTTIQENGFDIPILSSYIVGALLNGLLIFQILYYTYLVAGKKGDKQKKN